MNSILVCSFLLLATPPSTVAELFADIDPRREPLDIQTVREWREGDVVLRYVTYHVGHFKGRPARVAGFYAFPASGRKLPALLHLHGGGQRAFLHEVRFYAQRGYACLSINWGGREMEDARPDDPNTDWGAVDPTQQNVPGYFNLRPGEKYLDPFDSPRNNNWYLLTLAARRGLTFLELQPEVDPERLGVYGHSMGGNLTIYVAGSDSRVKAAAPSVGGSGFRTRPRSLLPEQKPQLPNGDVRLFDATLGFESYSPRIAAPLLWLGSTNDFHGVMDDTYLTGALVPHDRQRYAFTPHMNHRFTPEFAAARPLWFDQHLQAKFVFPATPKTQLLLDADDHIPRLEVEPDAALEIVDVQIFYSIDPDPRARFWRSAEEVEQRDRRWTARLPILSVDQPLFAFANVHYRIAQTASEPHAPPTQQLAISSLLHTVAPKELAAQQVVADDRRTPLIDDFAHGWRDWYKLSADNPHHWEYSTRKIADSKWRGAADERLAFDVQAARANALVIVLTENFFRSYRGPQHEYVAVVPLTGGDKPQHVSLAPRDFQTLDGRPLASWEQLDLLSFRAYFERNDRLLGSKAWAGAQPVFQSLRWEQP
ncbi:MAG: acetylxylan esterase [Pirellulales bacterium]